MATCLAIEHYLLGPEEIFDGIAERHRRLLLEIEPLMAEKVEPDTAKPPDPEPAEKLHPLLPSFLKDALCVYWSFIHGLRSDGEFSVAAAKTIYQDHLSWPWTYGERGVVVHDPLEGDYRLYQRDSRMAWTLARRFMRAMRAWRGNEIRLRETYAAAAPAFTTWESWERILGREIPRPPPRDTE